MFDKITVYHGGTEEVPYPKVDVGRPNLDFGPGFYVTEIYTQAKDWAIRVSKNRDSKAIVNSYLLDKKDFLHDCKHLIFPEYNNEWLEFVTSSRLGKQPWLGYDYIEGGVADDKVVNTLRLYMTGYISAEDALQRLQYYRPANQICILNQKLLDNYLTFIESESVIYE